jgi:hypothetical protein
VREQKKRDFPREISLFFYPVQLNTGFFVVVLRFFQQLNLKQLYLPSKEYFMTTRHLIAAAILAGSACGAYADVLPATTGNGTDVASSGVLGSGTTLVGGASTGNASLAQALYDKASANVGSTNGKINLSVAEGINGTYVVKTGNKMLAALYGDGAQVVTTADGTTVSRDTTSNDVAGGGAVGVGANVGTTAGNGGNANQVSGTTPQLPTAINGGSGSGVSAGLPNAGPAAINGTVPEPSSLALLMAGMMGALALTRRRAR